MVLIGPHDDAGWSQAHYEGLQYLCEHVPDTHVAYVEIVPEGADSEQDFRSLARKGFDFIIGTSFGYMDPMETVAERVPGHDVPPPDRLQVATARTSATSSAPWRTSSTSRACSPARAPSPTATRSWATWPRSRSRRRSGWATRSCSAPSRPAPSARWTSRCINTWHDPAKEKDGAASLFDAGAQVVFTGADTPANADVAQEKGKWAVTYDHPARARSTPASPPRTGSGDRSTPASPRRSRPAPTRPATSTSTPTRRRWACSGSWTARRRSRASPTCRPRIVQKVKDTLAKMLAGEFDRFDVFAGPIDDNTGKELLPAGAEARAGRPRPVPARRPGQRVQDLHVLVERGHHGRAAGPRRLGSPEAGAGGWRAASRPVLGAERQLVTAAGLDGAAPTRSPAVEIRGIVKRFPGVIANDHVDFDAAPRARSMPCSARTAPARARS